MPRLSVWQYWPAAAWAGRASTAASPSGMFAPEPTLAARRSSALARINRHEPTYHTLRALVPYVTSLRIIRYEPREPIAAGAKQLTVSAMATGAGGRRDWICRGGRLSARRGAPCLPIGSHEIQETALAPAIIGNGKNSGDETCGESSRGESQGQKKSRGTALPLDISRGGMPVSNGMSSMR